MKSWKRRDIGLKFRYTRTFYNMTMKYLQYHQPLSVVPLLCRQFWIYPMLLTKFNSVILIILLMFQSKGYNDISFKSYYTISYRALSSYFKAHLNFRFSNLFWFVKDKPFIEYCVVIQCYYCVIISVHF